MFEKLKNNRGFLGVGGGYSQGKESSRSKKGMEYMQAPDYKESEGARGDWWAKLQQFSGQPGYGAIAPDWENIWQNAQKKVQQYFWGSPTDPGMVNKVKSSAARRNVSESPAMENSLMKMGATEGNIFADMATQEAQSKAGFAEGGRQDYMQNLMQLSGLNPQGKFWSPWQTSSSKKSGWKVGGEAGR